MQSLLAGVALCLAAVAPAVGTEEEKPDRLGRKIADFTLQDFRGKPHALADLAEKKAIVVAFVGVECPIAKLYASRLQQLAADYADQNVAVLGVDSNQQDSITELAHFARTHGVEFPLLKDPGNRVADQFRATRTPEVFLLNKQREVVYVGRIDDQYHYGLQAAKRGREHLKLALDQLLASEKITTPETETYGCHIGRVLQPREDSPVTYSNQIARILNKRCVSCHRSGEIAPFALTNYKETVGWAEMIAEVVADQRMPPWHANPEHGEFRNDARLTKEEKQLLYAWVDAGAPEGDQRQLPEPPQFKTGWQIGEPDQVVYMSKRSFTVPAEGEVKYQYFFVDPGFEEDKWIKAAECRPGNRAVVHHIIVGVIPPGGGRAVTHAGVKSQWLTATAPGAKPLILRPGLAKLVPAGSRLFFQMHYTPNGSVQQDRSSVGLVFADPEEVEHVVATQAATNHRLRIPPGERNHHVESSWQAPKDVLLLSMFPHMHLRGKAFRYTAAYPDGREEVLLDVPGYDFNWQNAYELREPKRLPAGTRIRCDAWYDNSEENLANPDPTETVRWGDQTWEEMMIGYFDVAVLEPVDARPVDRVAEFKAALKQAPLKATEELDKLLEKAADSDEGFAALREALVAATPPLDRVDVAVLEKGRLKIVRCKQPESLLARVGGKGINITAAGKALADYAEGNETVVHNQLGRERAVDLRFMARVYGSSVHIPVRLGDQVACVNFWSTEAEAFPPEAVRFYESLLTEFRRK